MTLMLDANKTLSILQRLRKEILAFEERLKNAGLLEIRKKREIRNSIERLESNMKEFNDIAWEAYRKKIKECCIEEREGVLEGSVRFECEIGPRLEPVLERLVF